MARAEAVGSGARDGLAHALNLKELFLEIKTGSTASSSDAAVIRRFRDLLKKSRTFVWGIVLHAGRTRPLDTGIVALPWGWMVAAG